MKVLVATPWGERLGGGENVMFSYLANAAASGAEPTAVFLAEGSFSSEVANLGVASHVLPVTRLLRGGSLVSATRALARVLRAERPDAIVGWGIKPHLYLSSAARLAGLADRVVWLQMELPDTMVHRLATMLPARAIGCVSHFLAAAQQGVWPRRPTFVWYPGVEPYPPPEPSEVEAARAQLGLPREARVIGTVGRLVPVKRHDLLIRAVAALRGSGHDVVGLVVGGDPHGFAPRYEDDLRALARDLGCEDAIFFTGHVENPARYLSLMDVFMSASIVEAFGVSVVEAMAAGVPVVVAPVGGPTEIVEANRSGLVAADANAKAFSTAIARLLSDTSLYGSLVEAGRKRAGAFTAARAATELTDQLRRLVGSNGK